MQVKIDYLSRDVDRHGNVRLYVRRAGCPKVRIREKIGTQAFWEAYHAALEIEPKTETPVGSLRWLTIRYRKSAEFKELGRATRRQRTSHLERFCAAKMGPDKKPAGGKPFKYLEPKHVRIWRDDNTDMPEATNSIMKALRVMFHWAVEADIAEKNPAKDVPYLKNKSDGFHAWTAAEVEQFKRRHPIGTKAYLALSLLLYTGVRRSDVVRLGRQMEKNGWLHFTETKGRDKLVKERDLPILPELRAAIAAYPSGHLTYLITAHGRSFTAQGFGNWFRVRCDEAGLKHCSAHGLRKAAATIAAENGASEKQLMAIFGWESGRQAGHYTKRADRKRLAGDAMHLLVSHNFDESVPPEKTDRKSGG